MSQTYNATLVLLDYYYVHAHTLSKLFQLIKSSFSQASNHILVLTVRPTWLRNSEFHWWRVVRTSSPKGNDRSPENKQVFSNSSLVNKRFFQLVKGSQLCSQWLTKFWIQSRVVTLLQICQKKKKWSFKIPIEDLLNDNVYTKFDWILSIHSKDMKQKPNSCVDQGS